MLRIIKKDKRLVEKRFAFPVNHVVRSLYHIRDVWQKNHNSNHYGSKGRNKHSARSDVFGISNEWMKPGVGRVGQKLKGCIKCFCRPYGHDGQDEPSPLIPSNMEKYSGSNNKSCRDQMNPCVMLGTNHDPYATQGIFETSNSSCKLKWPIHFFFNRTLRIYSELSRLLRCGECRWHFSITNVGRSRSVPRVRTLYGSFFAWARDLWCRCDERPKVIPGAVWQGRGRDPL